jgi:hypothetical protein
MSVTSLLKVSPDNLLKVTPSEYALSIDWVSQVIRRDRGSKGDSQGRKKKRALQEISYVYHMCEYTSPYFTFSPEQRHERLAKDIFDDPRFVPDKVLKEGMRWYQQLQTTPSMRLLRSAYQAISKLEGYLNSVEFDSKVKSGKLLYDPKEVIMNLDRLSKVVSSIKELDEQVRKEQTEPGRNYGDIKVNKYSK